MSARRAPFAAAAARPGAHAAPRAAQAAYMLERNRGALPRWTEDRFVLVRRPGCARPAERVRTWQFVHRHGNRIKALSARAVR